MWMLFGNQNPNRASTSKWMLLAFGNQQKKLATKPLSILKPETIEAWMCFAFVHYLQMTNKRAREGEEEPGEKCYIMPQYKFNTGDRKREKQGK